MLYGIWITKNGLKCTAPYIGDNISKQCELYYSEVSDWRSVVVGNDN